MAGGLKKVASALGLPREPATFGHIGSISYTCAQGEFNLCTAGPGGADMEHGTDFPASLLYAYQAPMLSTLLSIQVGVQEYRTRCRCTRKRNAAAQN